MKHMAAKKNLDGLKDEDYPISLRLPVPTVKKIDALIRRKTKDEPGVRHTRTSIIRGFVTAGLAAEKAKSKGL
jgi:DNA-binding Lrp family transcriptional regulator